MIGHWPINNVYCNVMLLRSAVSIGSLRTFLISHLEQKSCIQDMVLERSYNKDSVIISKIENEFL